MHIWHTEEECLVVTDFNEATLQFLNIGTCDLSVTDVNIRLQMVDRSFAYY
ncbi:hypothetical protein HJFPF1_04978 [Paramyrothecium foliicola]|nr:hypothetical protein HJFPF1_04978 [Paramyrothecium foliicola]